MTIWEFIKLDFVSSLAIAGVVIMTALFVLAVVEYVKFCVWYHDHRKGKF